MSGEMEPSTAQPGGPSSHSNYKNHWPCFYDCSVNASTGEREATGLPEFKAILVYSLKSEFQASLDMSEAMPPPPVCVLVYQCGQAHMGVETGVFFHNDRIF